MWFAGDSFFTLSIPGQLGLACLSLGLAAALLWAVSRLRGRAVRLAAALMLFSLFVWLSPQVYYLYYQAIFDGLPWQVVVKPPPGPGRILRLLTFTEQASLSGMSQGALGWAAVLVAVLARHGR